MHLPALDGSDQSRIVESDTLRSLRRRLVEALKVGAALLVEFDPDIESFEVELLEHDFAAEAKGERFADFEGDRRAVNRRQELASLLIVELDIAQRGAADAASEFKPANLGPHAVLFER